MNSISGPHDSDRRHLSASSQVVAHSSHSRRRYSSAPVGPSLEMYTDASTAGWEAELHRHTARGLWSPEESSGHINQLEMLVVMRACVALSHLLQLRRWKIEDEKREDVNRGEEHREE